MWMKSHWTVMKRTRIDLESIAAWDNLLVATWRAQSSKRCRTEVRAFASELDRNLGEIRDELLSAKVLPRASRVFRICDPKPRIIHAPSFRDRVIHHAIMAQVSPVLERALIADTFACRVGKGTLAAVKRAQQHVQRFRWFAKMDVSKYFASIDHEQLKRELRLRIKGQPIHDLLASIVDAHNVGFGAGLPIGALTSQHFANYFLNRFDRALLEDPEVTGYVRYMDDIVYWCHSKEQVRLVERQAKQFLSSVGLTLKQPMQIQQSRFGLTLCGFRVYPGSIRLGMRRRRLIALRLRKWHKALVNGDVSSNQAQQAIDAIVGVYKHVNSLPSHSRFA